MLGSSSPASGRGFLILSPCVCVLTRKTDQIIIFEGVHKDKVPSWASCDTVKTKKWPNITIKETGCFLAHFNLTISWFPKSPSSDELCFIACLMFLSPFKWQRKKQEECENHVKFTLHPTRGKGKCTCELFIYIPFQWNFSGTNIFRLPYSASPGDAREPVNFNIRYSSLLNILSYFIHLAWSPCKSSGIAPWPWSVPSPSSILTGCIQSAAFSNLSCCLFCRGNWDWLLSLL